MQGCVRSESWFPKVLGALFALAAPAHVAAQGAFAGTYQVEAPQVQADILAWAPACGPEPQGQLNGDAETVEVSEAGAQLILRFAQRELRTDRCWSPNPAVRLSSNTAAAGRWHSECRSPSSLESRESARYSVVASKDGALEIREDSEYELTREGTRCVATIHATQRLSRVIAAAAAPASTSCTPGPLSKLRLRPSSVNLEPGQRVCFEASGFDEAGCAVALPENGLRWELRRPSARGGSLSERCFRAAPSAAEAEGTFFVAVGLEGLTSEARVVVAAPDLSAITARRDLRKDAAEEPHTAAVTTELPDRTSIGGARVLPKDSGWRLVTLTGAAALALAAFAAALSRRRSKHASATAEPPTATASPQVAENAEPRKSDAVSFVGRVATPPAQPAAASPSYAEPAHAASDRPLVGSERPPAALICPHCRRGYTADATVCATDGVPLLPYSQFVADARRQNALKTCPGCGVMLPADAAFCSSCGRPIQR